MLTNWHEKEKMDDYLRDMIAAAKEMPEMALKLGR